ncbi:heparan-alpha-glucosaminide N-acetyltransferase domain-containing protein [Candidatus Hodarchaeum mangrovi]
MALKEEYPLPIGKKLTSRIAAIDFVRGLVMILMALDHASSYWNSGRFFGEFYYAQRPLILPDLLQFLIRFVSHWCAPTFICLAGTSMVFFESRRLEKGVSQKEITKHYIIRGIILLLIEWILIAPLFKAGFLYFGVLAIIGVGFILFAFIRKLDTKIILSLSLLLLLSPIFGEFIWNPLFNPGAHPVSFSIFNLGNLGGFTQDTYLKNWLNAMTYNPAWPYGLYPLDPWLGIMGLGIVLGRWILKQQKGGNANQTIAKHLFAIGGSQILLFFILRTTQGFPFCYFPIWQDTGVLIKNAFTIQNYFFMSKYPPSIVFLLWTLGGMCLILAFGFYFEENIRFQKLISPILVFGTSALYFYCAHLLLYGAIPEILNLVKGFSVQITLIVWIIGLILLYPSCLEFQKWKKKYPNSVLKYF